MMGTNSIFAGATAIMAFLATLGIQDFFDEEVAKLSVTVERLEFDGENFIQSHIIDYDGGDVIDMTWVAQITRGGEVLCSGGGQSPYTSGKALTMTPDYWTYDTCPPLADGDIGLAAWRWTNPDGTVQRISADVVIKLGDTNE